MSEDINSNKFLRGPHAPAFTRAFSRQAPLKLERDELIQTIEENRVLRFLIRMPRHQLEIYRQRIEQLESEIEEAGRLEEALRYGYQPYTPPADWYVGAVDEKDITSKTEIDLIFRAPMPKEAIEKYQEARKRKLFSLFLVAAPDRSLFRRIQPSAPTSLYVDPVLIGYIPTQEASYVSSPRTNQGKIAPGIVTEGLNGFLIAYWDLEKDLKSIENSVL